jgi:hypothetical protein
MTVTSTSPTDPKTEKLAKRPFVRIAAKEENEPILTNAARRFNVCFANAFDAQSG